MGGLIYRVWLLIFRLYVWGRIMIVTSDLLVFLFQSLDAGRIDDRILAYG